MNNKKAIILDMDETLEHGIMQSRYGIGKNLTMILRPNLDELIDKLKEVKKHGIDVILCTTARDSWVERFLNLKPEFRSLFDKRYTRDNEQEWRDFSKEKYPIEYKAKNENINLEQFKPITTFGYDSVLYIDDNKIDSLRLKMLFEMGEGKLEKDVTHFTAFGFHGGRIAWSDILVYRNIASKSLGFSQMLEKYLQTERSDMGCRMMCTAIDKFINKEFKAGLTLIDEEFSAEYNMFSKRTTLLREELEKFSYELKEELDDDIFDFSTNELKEILNTDKKYPYQGIGF